WGNFFNREAYGAETNLPWRMALDNSGAAYHPCFLYESIWCILGFVLLHFYSKKHRKFNGEIFLMYVAWYGFGRFFIEGLRTDSLMLGNTPIRVSQLLSALAFFAAIITLIVVYKKLWDKRQNDTTGYTPIYSAGINSVEDTDTAETTNETAETETDGEAAEEPSSEPSKAETEPKEAAETDKEEILPENEEKNTEEN
ncbi:MAG TPA: prolipoprotein diacylglyceryl transferase, partial [Clostridia bacterium]|nr:prolipoprotein diacylglyceryl transferase [Clostridia bacterium]